MEVVNAISTNPEATSAYSTGAMLIAFAFGRQKWKTRTPKLLEKPGTLLDLCLVDGLYKNQYDAISIKCSTFAYARAETVKKLKKANLPEVTATPVGVYAQTWLWLGVPRMESITNLKRVYIAV